MAYYSILSRSDGIVYFVTVALIATLALYAIAIQVRIWLSEGAVYLANTYISVPQANREALPSIFRNNKNIRISYTSINDVTSTVERHFLAFFRHEYLHIHYKDKETTIDSAMFESEALFEQFKSGLYSRLNIKQITATRKQSDRHLANKQ
jgi:hypothetical protein